MKDRNNKLIESINEEKKSDLEYINSKFLLIDETIKNMKNEEKVLADNILFFKKICDFFVFSQIILYNYKESFM